jgi:hypothetical protein
LNFIIITTKFSSKCIECNEWILKNDTCYYKNGHGVKCYPECDTGITEDKTELIIFDEQDEDFYLK